MGLVVYGVLMFIVFPILYLGYKAYNSEAVDNAIGNAFGFIFEKVLKLPWPLQISIYILFIYLIVTATMCFATLTLACAEPWGSLGLSGWGFNLFDSDG